MELLAPAKDLETLACAFDSGADAVYAGLKKFSARARAKNLSIEDLYKACDIKKKNNKKLYIALNTIVFENEIKELLEILIYLKDAGVDGLIIQDYGVYQLIKDFGISIPLHASTQMGTKNHIQANFLEKLGFKRIILERQLTLGEIRSIRKKTNIDLEVFVHGAMCFSLSGYCFFSKMLGERSGNRGDCAQPCRWSFVDNNKRKSVRPFFMRDLCAISLLSEFYKIGINSIKIEGRLKGVEYVNTVVSTYRVVLDSLDKLRDEKDIKDLEQRLSNAAFTRQLTKGFYSGIIKNENLKVNDFNSAGLYVGKVAAVYEKSIFFKTSIEINVGDGLRIVNFDDTSYKIPVKAIYKNNQKVKKAEAGDVIGVPCNFKGILKGANIYLVHHRFKYKTKFRIPDEVLVPDVKKRMHDFISAYEKKYAFFYEKNKPKIINLKFEPDKIFTFDNNRVAFIMPDIYESEISKYDKILKNKRINSLFISHPAEAVIFSDKIIFGSFYIYVANKPALFFMKSLGVKGFSIIPDLDDKNFKMINLFSPLWFSWKNVPLWITRVPVDNCLFLTQKGNKKVKVFKNFGFLLE